MLQIVPAIRQDAFDLAPRMRSEDVSEVLAASGLDPVNSLLACYDSSKECYAITTESGLVVALFGVGATHSMGGIIWLLGSDDLQLHHRDFLRYSRVVVKRLLNKYGKLWNFIDPRNASHRRWLEWCGFKFTGETTTLKDPTIHFLEFEQLETP